MLKNHKYKEIAFKITGAKGVPIPLQGDHKGNVIKLRNLISNAEFRMLNIELKTSAFEIQYSLFDI